MRFGEWTRTGLRTGEQFGASMIRIGTVLCETAFDQQIGDALHALPSQAHAAANRCHAAGLVQDAAKHLPPGGGQVAVGRQVLSRLRKRALSRKVVRMRSVSTAPASVFATGLGPSLARRHLAVARVWHSTHAACWACMRTGEAGRIAAMEHGLVRLERATERESEAPSESLGRTERETAAPR